MKFFAKTPEEKAEQALQAKLLYAWFIMLFTSIGVLIADRALFGKFGDISQTEAVFFSVITVNFITLVPMIIRSDWKKILQRIFPSALLLTIILLVFHRYIY